MNANAKAFVELHQKQTLTRYMKNPDFEYRSLPTLAKAIGEPEDVTIGLLNAMGATSKRKRRTGTPIFKLA